MAGYLDNRRRCNWRELERSDETRRSTGDSVGFVNRGEVAVPGFLPGGRPSATRTRQRFSIAPRPDNLTRQGRPAGELWRASQSRGPRHRCHCLASFAGIRGGGARDAHTAFLSARFAIHHSCGSAGQVLHCVVQVHHGANGNTPHHHRQKYKSRCLGCAQSPSGHLRDADIDTGHYHQE